VKSGMMREVMTTLNDVLATLDLERVNAEFFVGTQLDSDNHHIVGGHIAAQALMAASRTVTDRAPHSMHAVFLLRGDARQPVDFEVTELRDGGTLSARRVLARQNGAVLMEALTSFSAPVDALDYQQQMPAVPGPKSLPPIQEQLSAYADELGGWWVRPQPFEMRYVDTPARIAIEMMEVPEPRIRMWWRPNGTVPSDPIVHSCLLAYISALTLLEPATTMHRSTAAGPAISALVDHAVWFHRQTDLSDWLLYDQFSPSGGGSRALVTGSMYNRTGELVCTATQEGYFSRKRRS
jgi:acyl-CoA thioesterase-2